jgi:hypothetical protein
LGECQGCHFFDVGACRKGALGACEEDCADGGGLVEGGEGAVQFGDEGCREGIEGFGAIKRNWGLLVGFIGGV